MHIGIIFYSVSGTTEEFASRIANALLKHSYHIDFLKIKTDVEVTAPGKKFEITNDTDCSRFDIILFGGPVWAFSACPVVIEYIKKSKGISGKKIIPFVTMACPFKFMGGYRALNQISEIAKNLGAEVLPGVIIPKLFHDFHKIMDKEVLNIVSTIKDMIP